MTRRWKAVLGITAAWALNATAGGALRTAAVFGDHMVLQQGRPVPVWGSAQPGERVTVEFAGQRREARADAGGAWRVTLGPLEASAQPRAMTVRGAAEGDAVTIGDVVVGEVWLCSGQSNMERQLGPRPPQKPLHNWEAEAAAANFPLIRHFGVEHKAGPPTSKDVTGRWEVCSPGTVTNFTAVGYFFGRELHRELNMPVGLLHSSWGGSKAVAWISPGSLESPSEVRALREAATAALATTNFAKPRPTWTPSAMYESMIAPLVPYAIRGAAWYQGESDCGNAAHYRALFPLLIRDWRGRWGQGDFPFVYVQLPNMHDPVPQPADSPWAELREAQTMALAVTNTAMAITIDIGEAHDIHPRNKLDVGRRLAKAALKLAYGRPGEASGPLYRSVKFEGGSALVSFDHAEDGLVARGGGPLKRFEIAGADGRFVWADAAIEGAAVRVSSPQVSAPAAVRYAWADNPEGCNLYNRAGLPASPFRTDGPRGPSRP